MSGDNTRRIALRLTPQEDDEINDYLSTTLKFKTKSEFIRAAIFYYIKNANLENKKESKTMEVSRATLAALEPYVKKGYFDSIDSALDYIVDRAGTEGLLPALLNKRAKWVVDARKMGESLPDIDAFENQEAKDDYER